VSFVVKEDFSTATRWAGNNENYEFRGSKEIE
jgi:hypothetical protein